MSLLTPAFLAGLLALGIPVLVHLIRRERREVVEFPSLMFLQRIEVRTIRQQRLRHLMLLTLRCLALALLVAAFARPYLTRRAAAGMAITGTLRVVLVDRSWSMGAGNRWVRAKAAATAAVRALGPADRAVVVAFAEDAAALTPVGNSVRELTQAIDTLTLASQGTRMARAVTLAADIIRRSAMPRAEVVLVGDLQRIGWGARDEAHLPAGTTLRVVPIGGDTVSDASVVLATAEHDRSDTLGRVTVTARLANGAGEARPLQATVDIAARAVETRTVSVPAHGTAQVRFAPARVPAGTVRAAVRLTRDALPANDRFDFIIASASSVPVLVIESPAPRARQTLFLERALALGERPTFAVSRRPATRVTASDLDAASVVVLDEVAPSEPLGALLRDFVRRGGGLVVLPGTAALSRNRAFADSLLPGRIGAAVDRTTRGGARIADLATGHPVFEAFRSVRSGDLSEAHVFFWRSVEPVPGATVLARFDDGSPALLERRVGNGRVLLWATTLDDYWTDLPVQSAYLPFTEELISYGARHQGAQAAYTVGDALDVSHLSFAASPRQLTWEQPNGTRRRIPADTVISLVQAGMHELRAAGTSPGSGTPIAVNVAAGEGDLTPMPVDELTAAIGTGDRAVAGPDALPAVERERAQSLWWYALLVAVTLLGFEGWWANRLSGVTA